MVLYIIILEVMNLLGSRVVAQDRTGHRVEPGLNIGRTGSGPYDLPRTRKERHDREEHRDHYSEHRLLLKRKWFDKIREFSTDS